LFGRDWAGQDKLSISSVKLFHSSLPNDSCRFIVLTLAASTLDDPLSFLQIPVLSTATLTQKMLWWPYLLLQILFF